MTQNLYGPPSLAYIVSILGDTDAAISVKGKNYSVMDLHELGYIDDKLFDEISSIAEQAWKNKGTEKFYESILNFRLGIEDVPKEIKLGENIVFKTSNLEFNTNSIKPYEVEKSHLGYSYDLEAEIKFPFNTLDIQEHPLITKGFPSDKIYEMTIVLGNTSITYKNSDLELERDNEKIGKIMRHLVSSE